MAVPAEWLEGAGKDGVELRLESDGAIPEDFRPRWMHPDAPLEMEFGVAVVPSCASYLSEEFRAFDGLRGLDAVFPYWPAPVQAREFAGDGTIRLPEGAGEDGAEYVVWLSVAPVCGERVGRMEVSVSLPEYPEAGTARAEMDHRERLTTLEFGFGRLPRSPRALRVHVEHDIPVREELLGNPRYHNVQIGELRLFARREVDSLEVRVGPKKTGCCWGTDSSGGSIQGRRNTGDGRGRGRRCICRCGAEGIAVWSWIIRSCGPKGRERLCRKRT